MTSFGKILLIGAGLAVSAGVAGAELRMSSVFGDGMVLQREMPVPVWGVADAGAEVTVKFAGQKKAVKAGADGKWRVNLDALKTNKKGATLSVGSNSGEALSFRDVLVGEVWLASGQSNMEWNIKKLGYKPLTELATSKKRSQLRLFLVHRGLSHEPKENVKGAWTVSDKDSVLSFSGTAWSFAHKLQQALDVPVGIISSSWGGSKIEPWISDEAFAANPKLAEIAKKRASAKKAKKLKLGNKSYGLYPAMIAPLHPFAVRGFLWYQGESNVGADAIYPEMKRALISGWREKFERADAPFLYVHLAPFRYRKAKPDALARMWGAQQKCLEIPNTGMVVTNDVGNIKDIHPRNKLTVGERLANLALKTSYGRSALSAESPLFESAEFSGEKVTVRFSNAGKGLKTRDGKAPSHFEVAGSDGVFHPAEAKIAGATVVLSSEVKSAKAVRFGWSDTAVHNLMNSAGLPAAAFSASK